MFIGMFKEFIEELAEEKKLDYSFSYWSNNTIEVLFFDPKTNNKVAKYRITLDEVKNEYSACVKLAKHLDNHLKYYYKETSYPSMFMPHIENVIFSAPATIVFWSDGTKTVVKCQDGDMYDPEKGLAMAISKKTLGNQRDYYHTFLKWIKKYNKETEEAKAAATFAKFLHHINCSFDE